MLKSALSPCMMCSLEVETAFWLSPPPTPQEMALFSCLGIMYFTTTIGFSHFSGKLTYSTSLFMLALSECYGSFGRTTEHKRISISSYTHTCLWALKGYALERVLFSYDRQSLCSFKIPWCHQVPPFTVFDQAFQAYHKINYFGYTTNCTLKSFLDYLSIP